MRVLWCRSEGEVADGGALCFLHDIIIIITIFFLFVFLYNSASLTISNLYLNVFLFAADVGLWPPRTPCGTSLAVSSSLSCSKPA